MSLVQIQGNASGTGTLTIAAPNTNTNRTLTLPDATTTFVGTDATQTLTNKTLTSPTLTTPNIDSAQFETVSGTAPIYPCRAWVNFNGSGTVAIRGSGNVSSITDNGTGDYTVNFTTAMPDANYSIGGSVQNTTTNTSLTISSNSSFSLAAASARIITRNGAGSVEDPNFVSVAIFR